MIEGSEFEVLDQWFQFATSKAGLDIGVDLVIYLRYCTVLHCTALYYIVLYYSVLYCTVLYCTVLYCTVLHCTAI